MLTVKDHVSRKQTRSLCNSRYRCQIIKSGFAERSCKYLTKIIITGPLIVRIILKALIFYGVIVTRHFLDFCFTFFRLIDNFQITGVENKRCLVTMSLRYFLPFIIRSIYFFIPRRFFLSSSCG